MACRTSGQDERGLGYGIGYAYARDNACLLAEEIVTARGERARYFGSEGKSSAELDNLPSDIFYAWLNQPEALQAFWQAQTPAVRQLLEGYAAGFNRFLREADGKTTSCLGQPWLRAIATDDLLRLTRRLLVEGGVGQFADALVAAAPPGTEKVALSGEQAFQVAEQRRQRFRLERGSNAIAVGSERSADGKGMLLANPHFLERRDAFLPDAPDHSRPARRDGASLPGLPVVNIGFSRHLAWTHTVDTSSHFTLYRLALDEGPAALPGRRSFAAAGGEVRRDRGARRRRQAVARRAQGLPVDLRPAGGLARQAGLEPQRGLCAA